MTYVAPWYSQLQLLENITTSDVESTQKPQQETTGQKPTKVCCTCKIEKNIEDFSKDSTVADGIRARCKSCCNKHNKIIATLKKSAPPKPKACQCCRREDLPLSLDHDYETELFRGWICQPCNSGIGYLGDGLSGILKALRYVLKHLSTHA